ncbi:MAG: glycosyltransferase [Nitrosomonas sp.]|nr:glycosyltransferase [Nitrosomonas sp.]
MNHIVIITSAQFGYHTDTYYYCKYLKHRCNVTYIGWNHGLPPVALDGIEIISVSRKGGLTRVLRLLNAIWRQTTSKNSIVFIPYFKLLSWFFRLIRPHNPMVLDIRTGSVEKSSILRFLYDNALKIETLFFKHITVISSGLSGKLGLRNTRLLPLGAETISPADKVFDTCRMLYVGTLYNRRIETLIHGLADYHAQADTHDKKIFLTIVGDGSPGQLDGLIAIAAERGLNDIVAFTGRVPHDQLKPIFDTHNVGISYIPLTPFFDHQPPTKTFEYLMSGMPVIATKTNANQLIITSDNGVLIGDTTEEVCRGIKVMLQKLDRFSSEQIRQSCQDYEWPKIVDNLYTYLCNLK